MGPIRHGGYGPPRESFVGLKWAEEMMMVVVVVVLVVVAMVVMVEDMMMIMVMVVVVARVMVGDGGDDENGKNYDENNDWEKVWGGLLVGFTGMVMVI